MQDNNGFPSAGYHGYWITDFTQIDPHLGTNDDLAALIRRAHGMGMKVYFDIITNHTADVIRYAEGAAPVYKSKDESPFRTAAGTPFDDRDYAGGSTFPALAPTGSPRARHPVPRSASRTARACRTPSATSRCPPGSTTSSLYHNRGNTTFAGENSQYGDFFGLDDLFTEDPRVVDGMIDIYKTWIRDFRIDGFRMDTMKHVDDAFWQKFAPAIERYAKSQGVRDFYMFGEVAEDTSRPITSHYMTHDDVQGVLDFPFQTAATRFAANSAPTSELRRLLPRRRLVHGRRLERLQPADLPREPRQGADRHVHPQREPGGGRGRAAAARPARARAHVLLARQPGRLLRRRAGLHRQRRRPGRAAGHVPLAVAPVQQPDRRRRHR